MRNMFPLKSLMNACEEALQSAPFRDNRSILYLSVIPNYPNCIWKSFLGFVLYKTDLKWD